MVPEGLKDYLMAIESDVRLNSWHVALLSAILVLSIRQERLLGLKASRRQLMNISHIGTIPTFHKYFSQLQDLGYIAYRPSYHPGIRSEIDIKKQT